MIKKISFLVLLAIIAGVIWQLKTSRPNAVDDSKPLLLVSVLPQKQIVKKIAGDEYEVVALVPPGFNPATYDPTPTQIKQISRADIYFMIGQIAFEKSYVNQFLDTNSNLQITDTSIDNELRSIESHTHDGQDLDHAESAIDPHVWLSPPMVKQQARIIKDTLINKYPSHKDVFEKNYQQLALQLNELDSQLRTAFAPIAGQTMLVYHPAFGYLADEYGFVQEHIEIEGKKPSVIQLKEIIAEAKADKVKVIFVQQQFNQDSAEAIADNIDGVVITIDPLNPDYLGSLKNMANTISDQLQIN